MAYLLTVDLSGFNPHARPSAHRGRKILTEHSESRLRPSCADRSSSTPARLPALSLRRVGARLCSLAAPESRPPLRDTARRCRGCRSVIFIRMTISRMWTTCADTFGHGQNGLEKKADFERAVGAEE